MKKLLIVFLIISLCAVCGCNKKTEVDSKAGKEYEMSVKDMQIVYPVSVEGNFLLADNLCIFHFSFFSDEYLVEYYSKSLNDDSEPVKLGIQLPDEGFISDCYKDGIHILREVKEVFFLSSYDMKGNLIGEKAIADSGLDRCPNSIGVYDDGSFLISNTDALVLYNADGGLMNILHSDKYSFKSVIRCEGNNTAYIFAGSKGEKNPRNLLLKFDSSTTDYTEIELPMAADAMTSFKDDIYFASENMIYKVDKEENIAEPIFDFSDEGITYSNLCNVFEWDDRFVLLKENSSGSASRIFKTVVFSPTSEKGMPDKSVNLTLYDPDALLDRYSIAEIINSFNEDNPDIHVELKKYKKDINYVLSSNDRPDLIVYDAKDRNALAKSEQLLDLSKMLSDSQNLSEGDFIDGLIEDIQYNGCLFGLPRNIGIKTLGGVEDKLGEESGWTVDQFLDCLTDRPEILEKSWMQKEDLLRICLEGTLHDYDDHDYSKLLEKINRVTTYPFDFSTPVHEADISTIIFEAFNAIPEFDKQYGKRFVLKGFPSSTGEPRYILDYNAIGMLKTCENKEEAYRFIEYFVTWRYGSDMQFYSTKELFNWAREASGTLDLSKDWQLEKRVYMTEEQLDRPVKTLPYLTVLSDSDEEIIDIIVEESSPYFNGDKSLEETADVIKQRVSILLEERE